VNKKTLWTALSMLVLFGMLLAGCAVPAATPATTAPADAAAAVEAPAEAAPAAGAIQIPAIEDGKFNVAFVYVGPVGDGGWTYAHDEGRQYLEKNLDGVHTAYLESVPEGADAERVIRNLARNGFDAIFTTSFGYMDPTATVAAEFPDVDFVHVSGFKKAENFSNLFGGMESMKYLVGMIAGAKAAETGSNKVGYIAPFATAEVVRHINAVAMGMRKTCPECDLDIRWTFSWFDPSLEQESANSLIDAGASVVITGADSPTPVQAAAAKGAFGVAYDSSNACSSAPEACLTVPYWNWGPEYVKIVTSMMDGSFVGSDDYFDVDSGSLGLYGFMEGQTPQSGVPESVIPAVKELLAKMESGEFTRFDVFTGPIKDNKGNIVVPEGEKLTQSDLEGLKGIEGRPDCTFCMSWLAEGVSPDAELPKSE
jgi:basic membrane protein A and related proteins